MPICRSAQTPALRPARERVRLSRYVVAQRLVPRAANDNRRMRRSAAWSRAAVSVVLAVGALPALGTLMLLAGLF